MVQVYVPRGPTVAFSQRDLRANGVQKAIAVAEAAGFAPVVRSPGGRMVAYDDGAVVVDHLKRMSRRDASRMPDMLAASADVHVSVLRGLGVPDPQVGEIEGEYCPGEFSVSVAGLVKIIGSAQRVTSAGVLVSSVVQVALSERVRAVLGAVSEALDYPLLSSSIGGLADFVPGLTPGAVAAALEADSRARLGLSDAPLPSWVVGLAERAASEAVPSSAFHVEDWVRANLKPRPR
jgi:lipoate-protein ligase A